MLFSKVFWKSKNQFSKSIKHTSLVNTFKNKPEIIFGGIYMHLEYVIRKRPIYQQYKNWYVLDDEFSWNIQSLFKSFFKHLDSVQPTPVIFCTINEAKNIIWEMGDDEEEYLQFGSGIYWRELRIIFIFQYKEFVPLIETLFHEFRHVMQDQNEQFRHYFETDKNLPYEERITEIDAFKYAKEKTNEFIAAI